MKRLCCGVVLCGWLALAAGCGEVSATADDGAGRTVSTANGSLKESPANAKPSNGASNSNRKAIERAMSNQIDTDLGAQPGSVKVDQASLISAAVEEPAGANPVSPEKPTADKASTDKAAADKAKPRKPDKDGHLAPQQVATGGDGRAKNITFDNIKFAMDDPKSRMFKRAMLTESIEKLSGNRVRIRGFILPGALEEFTNFVLVRDNQECCFGPGSAIYDSIMVDMKQESGTGGKKVKFTTRPITVEGVFEVKELIGPDKKHWSIYRLTATKVE